MSKFIDWFPYWLSSTTKTLRFIRVHKLVWYARDVAIVSTLRAIHIDVVHQIRCLSSATTPDGNPSEASLIASNLCTRFRSALSELLELEQNQVHCCLKLIAPKAPDEEFDRLCTWVRSEPFDGRPIEMNPEDDFHAIDRNSVWSAFYGISDGSTHWQNTNCFACNDLVRRGDLFRCDRDSWQKYYKSTLVFPINRSKNADGSEVDRLGFLAFDSPKIGAFRGLPDIYDYRESLHDYRDLLLRSSAFHLGAICADLLGTSLAFGVQHQFPIIHGGDGHDLEIVEPAKFEGPGMQAE